MLVQNLNTYFTAVYARYRNFVGAPHFASLVALLNYQDIALLYRELLQLISNLV